MQPQGTTQPFGPFLALELSNVDLSREFINTIAASTGFSAASLVVITSD